MLPFNVQKTLKKQEKRIPLGLRIASNQWQKEQKVNEQPFSFGLRLDSIQWQKEFKEKRETNSLRIKTCFQSMAKGT